jgi:hypothetical protein
MWILDLLEQGRVLVALSGVAQQAQIQQADQVLLLLSLALALAY